MYTVTVLPHNAKTSAGKNPIDVSEDELVNLALCKVSMPVELVAEFDTWLDTKLVYVHANRPSEVIAEYLDPDGVWAGMSGLEVIYYVAVEADQLESIQQFATVFSDTRTQA